MLKSGTIDHHARVTGWYCSHHYDLFIELALVKAEMAAAAKVTIEQAIKTASDRVAGKVIEAELERKHNKVVWEVEVLTRRTRRWKSTSMPTQAM